MVIVSGVTNAQPLQNQAPERELEEVVVTGSYISGTIPLVPVRRSELATKRRRRERGNTDVVTIMLDRPYVMGSNARPGLG